MKTIFKSEVSFKFHKNLQIDLINFLNQTHNKGAVIVDDKDCLYGVVTKGDFIRFIASNKKLKINTNSKYAIVSNYDQS